ncbi:MAG: penicillin-insensitive murein endopeptidase [Myxococcota bacterium]
MLLRVPTISLAIALFAAAFAHAEVDEEPAPEEEVSLEGAAPTITTPTKSRSIGRTNRGWLRHSVQLGASPTIRLKSPSNAYGTQEMVSLLEWAAGKVNAEHPGSVMVAGDLSRRRGGRLRPHRSHRAGRDADIGFYLRDATSGEAAVVNRFVRMSREGKGTTRDGDYAFDDARNWTFIEALMSQDVVPIQYVMVIAPLKERLLAEGRRRGADEAVLARVEEAVGPRRTGRGRWARYGTHNSHFHIRIYCAQDDRPRCQDQAPFWDWISRPPPPRVSRRGRSSMRRRSARSRRGSMRRSSMRRSSMRRSSMRSSMRRSSMRSSMRRSARSSMRRSSMRRSSMRRSSMRRSSMRPSSMAQE